MVRHILNCRGGLDDAGYALAKYLVGEQHSVASVAKFLHTSWKTVKRNLSSASTPSTRDTRRSVQHLHPCSQQRKIAKRRRSVKEISACMIERVGPPPWRWMRQQRKFPTARAIANELFARTGTLVSPTTVRRDLQVLGFKARVRPKGPRRKHGDPQARIAFCREHLDLNPRMLLFTDEKYADCDEHGVRFEWCAKGEEPSPQTREQYKTKVHVWGAIGVGVKRLVVLPTDRVTAEIYVKHCLVSVRKLLENGVVLVQDGARAHTAGYTTNWLQRYGFTVLEHWPARSPDLNPLENLWALLAKNVSARIPLCPDDLVEDVVQEWDKFPQALVDDYVCSFNARLRKCIAAGGATINTRIRRRN